MLVDRVVGQMHGAFLQTIWRAVVLLRGQAYQAFFIDVDLQGIKGGDHNVEAQIELEAIDQQRPVNVALHHPRPLQKLLLRRRSNGGVKEADALAATEVDGLPDPQRSWVLLTSLGPGSAILRQAKPRRHDAAFFGKLPLHPVNVLGEKILPAQLPGARKVVRLLEGVEASQHFNGGVRTPVDGKLGAHSSAQACSRKGIDDSVVLMDILCGLQAEVHLGQRGDTHRL
mmetsp:Transcript_49956/g.119196  ORF Transcript_49956/g.119196 Transcript_49956/m.119196 type:complete len:228 (+) Transcript_49956:843-1526(+)